MLWFKVSPGVKAKWGAQAKAEEPGDRINNIPILITTNVLKHLFMGKKFWKELHQNGSSACVVRFHVPLPAFHIFIVWIFFYV